MTQAFASAALLTAGLAFAGCADDDNLPGSCYVQLYDGDNFKDDNIVVDQPGEYKNLKNLPGANGKDWTDEADSLRVGKGTKLTAWHEENFKGESKTYDPGDYKSVDEPSSMTIECVK